MFLWRRRRLMSSSVTILLTAILALAGNGQVSFATSAPGAGKPGFSKPPRTSVDEPAYRGGAFLETMTGSGSCRGVTLGHETYWPGDDASCSEANGHNAAYMVVDGTTLKPVTKPALTLLSGVDAGIALGSALTPWQNNLTDTQRYLVIVVAPPGCCSTGVVSADGASYVWNLSDNGSQPQAADPVADLSNIGTPAGRSLFGYKNEGRTIPSSKLVGDLAGYLEPVDGQDRYWSFVPSDYLNYDTKVSESTIATPWPTALPGARGPVMLISDSGLALNVPAAASGNGATATGSAAQGLPMQQWTWRPAPHNPGFYSLVNALSGRCLDVLGAKRSGVIDQRDCYPDQVNQLWKPVGTSAGAYTLASALDPTLQQVLTLDGPAGSTLHLQTPDGTAAQSWTVRDAAPFNPDVNHQVGVLVSENQTVLQGGSSATDSTITTTAETDLSNQRWELIDDGTATDTFQLRNISSQLCADVFGGSAAGVVQQYTCKDTSSGDDRNNQLWQFKPGRSSAGPDGSLALTSKVGGNVVLGADTSAAGSTLHVTADSASASQRWVFKPIFGAPTAGSTGVLSSSTGKVLDYTDGSDYTMPDSDQSLAANPETDHIQQQWSLVAAGTAGQLQLRNLTSGRCLTAPNTTAGATMTTTVCEQSEIPALQLWTVRPAADGSSNLVNAGTGLALAAGPVPTPPAPATPDVRDQTEWRDPGAMKKDLPGGHQEYLCSNYVPNGESNLYPYLSPDGNISYEYRKSGKNDISNVFVLGGSSLRQGLLSLGYATTGGNLEIAFRCLSQLSNNLYTAGLSVGAPTASTWPTHATITFDGQNGPRTCPTSTLCSSTLMPKVEWGAHYARYTRTASGASQQVNPGDPGDRKPLSVEISGLTPSTTYHYRARVDRPGVVGGTDTSFSDDMTFTTAPAPAPIVQVPLGSSAADYWTFRPTQHTLTMRIADSQYDAALPWSGSGFAVAGVSTSGSVTPPQAFPDTPGGARAAALTITAITSTPGSAVLVQSINHPAILADPAWTALANGVISAGGTANGLNALDGTGDYALVGCAGCARAPSGTAVEVNSAITSKTMPKAARIDQIAGQLALDGTTSLRSGSIAPGQTDPSRFLPLAYQRPGAWPIPQGVSASDNRAILNDIAVGAKMTSDTCYHQDPESFDPRADYCAINIPELTDAVSGMKTKPTGSAYSEQAFESVRDEISTEMYAIKNVAPYVAAIRSVFQDGQSSSVHDVVDKARILLLNSGANPGLQIDAGATVSAVLGMLSFAAATDPVIAAALGIASIGIGWLGGLDASGADSPIDPVTVAASQFTNTWDQRMQAAALGIAQAGTLLRMDYRKLMTAATYVTGTNPAARWDLSSDGNEIAVAQKALVSSAKTQAWNGLVPVAFGIYDLPASDSPVSYYQCSVRVGQNDIPHYYLADEPDSATFQSISLTDNGTIQHNWNVLANYSSNALPPVDVPPATLTDLLWKDPAGDPASANVGLFKEWFFAEHPAVALPINKCLWAAPTAPAPAPARPRHVMAIAGSGQSTQAGSAFPRPLTVTVTDGRYQPIYGVTVTFTLSCTTRTCNAQFSNRRGTAVATTGRRGQAHSPTIIATHVGAVTVTATISGLPPVLYHLTVTPQHR